MQGGAGYQNQISGWLAVKMLAERPAAPILPRGKLTYIAAESGEAVDDVQAGTDQGSFAFLQAKRRISLSTREGTDLEGVVNQAVRQIAAAVEPDKRPWSRTLNPASDRLLLVTSSDSPATIRTHLRNALQRIGGLHPEQTVMDAAKNQAEQDALTGLLTLVDREWTKATGAAPTLEEQRLFLKLFDVGVLDAGPGETHEREGKTDLASSVLEDEAQEHLAWTSLMTLCGTSATRQTGFTLDGLRRSLRADSLALKAVPSFASDIEVLRQHTKATLDQLAGLSRIRIGGQNLKEILTEYKEVLRRLHVRPAMIGAFVNLIRERGEAVEVRSEAEISPDPKDDPFCACSEAGRADLIFTLNAKDFPQSRLKAKVLAPTPVTERRRR